MTRKKIFREELPGEKKSVVNLLMWGYILVISILGYMAFYLTIQFGQIDRVFSRIDKETLSAEQFKVVKTTILRNIKQMRESILWLAILGSVFAVIGGVYTFNMVIRPLRKLVDFAETGNNNLPEFKTNNEIKQLATAITALTSGESAETKSETTKSN